MNTNKGPQPEPISMALRKAALGHAPPMPWLVWSWLEDEVAAAVVGTLTRLEDWWDRLVPIEDRRFFLLFVAEDIECIERANQAAYHGDIDGDFDY